MKNPLPWFVKVRGEIFHEDGYTLDAPAGLNKDANALFAVQNREGKVTDMHRVPGCTGGGEDEIFVHLKPYADSKSAHTALLAMCGSLEGARAGRKKEKEVFVAAWAKMIFQGLALEYQPARLQVDALSNLYGAGRVYEAMNRAGGVATLAAPNFAQIASEAFAK